MSQYWIARDGKKHGPYPEDQVRTAFASGRVLPTDLVWTEGMAKWAPASRVLGAAPSAPSPSQAVAASPYRPPVSPVRDEPERGLGGDVAYAGFWVRFGAVILDGIIVYILALAGGAVGGLLLAAVGGVEAAGAGGFVAALLAGFLYFALMESAPAGATLGKRAFRLRVVSAEGLERIGFGRAAGRYFARFVSMIVLYVGYLIQPFTARKQALHDMVCGTVVIARAPASRVLVAIAIILGLLIPVAGILAAIAIPAYQDYTVRARVAEAILTASPARAAVHAYISDRNAIPPSLEEAGARFEPTPIVQEIRIDPRSAALTVTLGFAPLKGRTILLEPQRAESGAIEWTCRPGTTARKYLPPSCRGE